MNETHQLLQDFVENGSEPAFRELVSRYTDLVYSTACRITGVRSHLVEDVAQTVFIDLARNARTLSPKTMLGGWLHRHTCFVAQKAVRTELRRQAREKLASEMSTLDPPGHHDGLEQAASVIDQAINDLKDEDRTAILLRFYERCDFRRVAQALGTTEDTAQKRVSRALDKLHASLGQRGIRSHISAVALGTALSIEAIASAPAGLAATLAGTALAGATAATAIPVSLTAKLALMIKLKTAAMAALLVGAVAAPVIVHHQAQLQFRQQNEQLRQLNSQLADSAAENERLANLLATAGHQNSESPSAELLRLRGEVGRLNRQLAEAQKVSARNTSANSASVSAAPAPDNDNDEKQKQYAMDRLNFPKAWMLAFLLYADQHQGACPLSFDDAASFFPTNFTNSAVLPTEQFEIVYRGNLNVITNPNRVIVLREREPLPAPNSGWVRSYGFADGHSELHRSQDANFEPWEAQLHNP